MISKEVKERLLQKDWYVECKTEQDADLVLQACDESGITWWFSDKATEYKLYNRYPVDIGFCKEDKGLTHSATYYKENEIENITDWFFNAIKNNDSKLTPQNAEQEHMVQILLAIMQKIPVEVNIGGEWRTSTILFPDMGYEYRIKPISTPLPISRELWSYIDKKWLYAAMDEDKKIHFYTKTPILECDEWRFIKRCDSDDWIECALNINTNGINWETSLTERPEDV